MSLASTQQSFVANALSLAIHSNNNKLKLNPKIPIYCSRYSRVSCRYKEEPKELFMKTNNNFSKLVIVTLAAGVLTLGSVPEASAAKSGGRIGGQAFRSAAPRPGPRINNNSRTNIYINPPVAPPLVGGYGYGYGYGWSPFSFFAPGPSVAVGVGGGFDSLAFFLFLGAAAAVVRRFSGSRRDYDDDDD